MTALKLEIIRILLEYRGDVDARVSLAGGIGRGQGEIARVISLSTTTSATAVRRVLLVPV